MQYTVQMVTLCVYICDEAITIFQKKSIGLTKQKW